MSLRLRKPKKKKRSSVLPTKSQRISLLQIDYFSSIVDLVVVANYEFRSRVVQVGVCAHKGVQSGQKSLVTDEVVWAIQEHVRLWIKSRRRLVLKNQGSKWGRVGGLINEGVIIQLALEVTETTVLLFTATLI
jgi:hypothetical protein